MNLERTLPLCKILEDIAPIYSFHIGLTGGVLYKEGERKDLDILVYNIRQEPKAEECNRHTFLAAASEKLNLNLVEHMGWRSTFLLEDGTKIDFFFPNHPFKNEDY